MRVSIRKLFAGLFVVFLLIHSLKAEPFNQKFLQTQWTTENGLPQNSISALTQMDDGYLWIGTFGGLVRFDGVRFKTYTTTTTPELKSNRITALAADNRGMLWIGTENGELICYKNGKFQLIDDGSKNANATIGEIIIDTKGILWTRGMRGLQTCTINGCRKEEFSSPVSSLRKDSEGNLWLISEHKLFKFQDGKFIRDKSLSDDIIDFEPHQQNGFWIVKSDEIGLYRNGEYQTVSKLIKRSDIVGTFVAPDGTFLLNSGKFLYQIKEGRVETYEINNVEDDTARSLFVDREGNIWIGRVGDGLIRLLNRRVQTLTKEDGFPPLSVNSIVEDRDGSIWFATNRGLVHWKNGKLEIIESKDSSGIFLVRGSLLIDSEGTLWNGTSEGLESRRDGKATFSNELNKDTILSSSSIFEDSRKNLWYSCVGCGVFVFDREKIIARYTTENGLVGNTVNFVKETGDGAIWLATRSGISRLKDGNFTNYKSENGLSNEYVRDIYEDQDGTLWFGTYGGGLNRFRDGKFIPITTKDGLFDDIVSRILVDDDDNFWMLGNRGIYSVNRQMLNDFADGKINQIYCSAYTTADGMITGEGNGGYQNAGTRTRDGKLWFPMINGVVIIDPKQEKLPPPTPIIEEVLVGRNLLDYSDKLELEANHGEVEIHYTGIGFRKPEQMRFRYKIEGLDDNWIDVGTRRIAYFPHLPSGEYRFQIIAANADGNWSKKIAELEIVVHPPFYRTWWFSGLGWFVLLSGLFGAFRYRKRRFAQDKAVREEFARRLLNAQETERHRIASEIHDNLGQQLLIIKNWATYCLSKTSKTSKIRPQITQIDEIAETALNDVRSIAKTLSPHHLDKAGLTNTIRFMIKQVAESSDIDFETKIDDVDGFLPKDDEINFYRIVQESVNNIVKHSQATKAKVILKLTGNRLQLTITDNGIGFYEAEADYHKSGMGLNGMTERARMLKGNLSVKSVPKKGTRISLEIGTQ